MNRILDSMITTLPGSSPSEFETGDFYLACYLRCIGYDLLGMRWEGRRAFFAFEDRPDRPADFIAFFGNRTEVAPLRFVSAIKDLKALLYAA